MNTGAAVDPWHGGSPRKGKIGDEKGELSVGINLEQQRRAVRQFQEIQYSR